MAEPELNSELVELWADRSWRLNNLYYIENKHGDVVLFELNKAQQELLDDLHDLNIILKARQLGFSTFILILALDCCLFNSHFNAGLVADTLDNAKGLLERVKFAYDRIDPEIQRVVPIVKDNVEEIKFGNDSSIEVGVSLRSSTKNFLHISEYGKICAKTPDKAKEIKSGALNTLAAGQMGFIESTAEGKGGDFHDKVTQAQKIEDAGAELSSMQWKLHFFPWFADPNYSSSESISISAELVKYFAELHDEHGIELSQEQKWWYTAKHAEQGEDMWKEYPSTPEEAFTAAKDGAYFAKEIRNLRKRGRIGEFPVMASIPVDTFWDWGIGDLATIWFHQLVAGRHRFVGYYENSGHGMAHYLDHLDKWRVTNGAVYGRHYGPHDFETRRPGATVFTIKEVAHDLGYTFETVIRTPDKLNTIQVARVRLPECDFDQHSCEAGIDHLENYSREWDERLSTWKPHPRHDEHSHGADGFFTFTDGFRPAQKLSAKKPRRGTIA